MKAIKTDDKLPNSWRRYSHFQHGITFEKCMNEHFLPDFRKYLRSF